MRKVAIITGTSGAIGKSIARRFKDADYLVCGLDKVELKNEDLDLFVEIDLNEFAVDSEIQINLISKIKQWIGETRIDALINNAAYQHVSREHPIPAIEMIKSYNINVIAPYMLITNLARHMAPGTGSVVNIGSIHSRLTKPGFLAYAMTKAALAAMTRGLALDFEDKIRINCIEPAAVETPMLVDGFKEFPEKMQELKNHHPQKRIATPAEIAELVFQISSSKIQFLHGSCIDMSGGISGRLHDPA